MTEPRTQPRYRFGVFEMDTATGELRRRGLRIRLHAQPFQVLALLLERAGEVLTRDDIARALWPDGTFVDYEHGVNSAINRLRDALGDKAVNPQFVETLARRGYRFIAPVERIDADIDAVDAAGSPPTAALSDLPPDLPPDPGSTTILATRADLPATSPVTAQTLFLLLQMMYLGFYIGALANLTEIDELLSGFPHPAQTFVLLIVTAAVLIPVRTFLICAATFRAPNLQRRYLRLWPVLLGFDILWSVAPFLLLHHINAGVALACMTFLVYSPFAQRSLVLMGAGGPAAPQPEPRRN